MVLFIASLLSFVTWLVLGFAGADLVQASAGTALAFFAVGGTMLHYVLACMKRHCRHGKASRTPQHRTHHGALG
jgi:sterol desaturase/sphingolipid hydroxylase (fatty acid hydroxylase superfamily)